MIVEPLKIGRNSSRVFTHGPVRPGSVVKAWYISTGTAPSSFGLAARRSLADRRMTLAVTAGAHP